MTVGDMPRLLLRIVEKLFPHVAAREGPGHTLTPADPGDRAQRGLYCLYA